MNIERRSVRSLSNEPAGHLWRNVVVAVLGGAVVLAAIGGASVWYRGGAAEESQVQAVTAPATTGAAVRHPAARSAPHTVYVVGSEEQALAVSTALGESAAIRNAAGEPPLLDEVVVVNSDEEAAAVKDAMAELNRILDSQRLPENLVVDLRGN